MNKARERGRDVELSTLVSDTATRNGTSNLDQPHTGWKQTQEEFPGRVKSYCIAWWGNSRLRLCKATCDSPRTGEGGDSWWPLGRCLHYCSPGLLPGTLTLLHSHGVLGLGWNGYTWLQSGNTTLQALRRSLCAVPVTPPWLSHSFLAPSLSLSSLTLFLFWLMAFKNIDWGGRLAPHLKS